MPGRSYTAGTTYRYGFNGKENDNEVKGTASQQDYGMRIYDPRLGRFLSEDPLTHKYPMLTPYQFASNSPISGIDLDGLEYYYAADGNLIAKSRDNNTQVRLIQAKDVDLAWQLLRRKSGAKTNDLNNISTDVGMNNDELNTRAFMSTFRMTENFSAGKPTEYNFLYGQKKDGGGTFTDKTYEEAPEDYKDHPRKYIVSWGIKQAQSPAGSYQINELTWNDVHEDAGVTDFSPTSQDKVAIYLMFQKGKNEITNGNVKGAMDKLNGRWSSLPGGKHAQVDLTEAKQIFKQYLVNELNGTSIIATPKGTLITTPSATTTTVPATTLKPSE